MTHAVALYSAVDEVLTPYEVDVAAATLTPRQSLKLVAKLQYTWLHPTRKHLYVTTSSGGPVSNRTTITSRRFQSGPMAPSPRMDIHDCSLAARYMSAWIRPDATHSMRTIFPRAE